MPHARLLRISSFIFVPWAAALCAFPTASCRTTATGAVEAAPLPGQWAVAEAMPDVVGPWLRHFGDDKVAALVREALAHNRDLQAAAARMRVARAGAILAGAERFPAAGLSTGGDRGERIVDGERLRSENYELSLNVSWEVDLWGRLRNRTRAAEAEAAAAEADFRGARLSVAANVAQAWFNAVEVQLQLDLAERTLETFTQDAAIAKEQFKRGIGNSIEILLTEANVASAESAAQGERRNLDTARRALEVLLGRYPSGELAAADAYPELERPVPAGLPSELLMRRPDLLASERRLLAAWERSQDARKNRLPSLRLTGSRGTVSEAFEDLFDHNDVIGNIAAGLLAPLFEGGRLTAERWRATALQDEALAVYAGDILTAFREVESALRSESLLREEERALSLAQARALEAEQKARELWRRGLEPNILTLLEAQRRSLNTQQNLLRVQNLRVQNRIDLYLALGGPPE
ncbi:MAG TPA: efflux transporter outer membrane subunit [Verrucomicrobiales bacterium]|nr:efflux transporter outer membrane subunit [Verrucomicrobiales bacterium]